jgi:hypothetical protein
MDRIENKSIAFLFPAVADEFVSAETVKSLESFGEALLH